MERWDDLGAWLGPRLGAVGPVRATGVGGPAAIGYSAATTLFDVAYESADGPVERRLVLRSESSGPPIYPAQVDGIDVEIEIQRRVMEALHRRTDVPVAAIVGHELDSAVIGMPFFVMEYVEGVVPAVNPPYTASGFFVDASPAARRQMITSGLEILADVHRVDWQAVGLGWLLPPGAQPTLARQFALWERCGRDALAGRPHGALERAGEVLRRDLPEGSAPVFCWGDARPGNIIWQDAACASVTDWEATSIGPPESDIGWWLMFDRTMHETVGIERLPGEPTREEQLAIYQAASGRRIDDIVVHELFAAYRYCVVVVQIANRLVSAGILPADTTFWVQNHVVPLLDQLIEEQQPT